MKTCTVLSLVLLFFVVSLVITGQCRGQTEQKDTEMQDFIRVNADNLHQTMEHFGASGCWWAQIIGGWDDENRNKIIQLLFDKENGIGLSLYRYNIGAGDAEHIGDIWRKTETFEVDEGVYDWTQDRNAVWVLKAAHSTGVEHFIAFVNSPPARMTVSGSVSGGAYGRPNLRIDMHKQFARYMVDVVRYLREEEGIPIGWISPINEPFVEWESNGSQEGCNYTVKECVAVTKALLHEIRRQQLDVGISVIESPAWRIAGIHMSSLLRDQELAPVLDTFGIHSYGARNEDRKATAQLAQKYFPNVRLWMTEWTQMKRPRDYGMDSALVLANTIHEDLTVGSVTSWQYWIAVSKYSFHDGLIHTDYTGQKIEETKRLWAMGNYSRFVRPGYVRIEVSCDNDALKICAFAKADESEFVIVVINDSDAAVDTGLSLTGIPDLPVLTVYETSDKHNLYPVYTGSPTELLSFQSRSVSTLVLSGKR